MKHRFNTPLGCDGVEYEYADSGKLRPVRQEGRLLPFAASYAFQGCNWAIMVWARNWDDAQEYARQHKLTIMGEYMGSL